MSPITGFDFDATPDTREILRKIGVTCKQDKLDFDDE